MLVFMNMATEIRLILRQWAGICLLVVGLWISGCSSTPERTAPTHSVVDAAEQMLGTPYRYGGTSPDGFDCSGLVYYSYARMGQQVPRTTAGLYHASTPHRLDQLQPGDLLFFRLEGKKVSHVAIYIGSRRFIHAPSDGKQVSYGSLNNDYWRKRLIRAGRL